MVPSALLVKPWSALMTPHEIVVDGALVRGAVAHPVVPMLVPDHVGHARVIGRRVWQHARPAAGRLAQHEDGVVPGVANGVVGREVLLADAGNCMARSGSRHTWGCIR